MVEGNTRRTRRGNPPQGFISLALRAEELSLTVASLRRYVNLGHVRGQVARTGNRIYVARDLTPVRARQQRKSLVAMGRVGREFAKTQFTKEQLLKNIQSLYQKLLQKKGIKLNPCSREM